MDECPSGSGKTETSKGNLSRPDLICFGKEVTVKPRGHVMLDEKAANTAHVAIGRNTGAYGGDNEAAIHVDCIFSAPEVEADGRSVDLPTVP